MQLYKLSDPVHQMQYCLRASSKVNVPMLKLTILKNVIKLVTKKTHFSPISRSHMITPYTVSSKIKPSNGETEGYTKDRVSN